MTYRVVPSNISSERWVFPSGTKTFVTASDSHQVCSVHAVSPHKDLRPLDHGWIFQASGAHHRLYFLRLPVIQSNPSSFLRGSQIRIYPTKYTEVLPPARSQYQKSIASPNSSISPRTWGPVPPRFRRVSLIVFAWSMYYCALRSVVDQVTKSTEGLTRALIGCVKITTGVKYFDIGSWSTSA